MRRPVITDIIAGLLIFLFVYTSLSKLYELSLFQSVLEQSPLIGSKAVFISWLIPISELSISLLLFVPRTRLLGFYGSFILMLIFTIYIGYMLTNTSTLPCSCGGILKQLTWKQHFVFNIVFTLLSLAGILLHKRRPGKSNINELYTIA